MNKSAFIVMLGVLILSACGEKKSVEPAAVKASATTVESTKPVKVEQPMQAPVEGMAAGEPAMVAETAKASVPAKIEKQVVKEVQAVIKKPVAVKSGTLSHEGGLALAGKSGCLICHKIEAKLIGPAWSDVAKRYKGDADAKTKLRASVKLGSKGKWAEVGGMPMPANSPRVSDENVDKLVSFILSL